VDTEQTGACVNLLREFFRDKTAPQLIMLGAILLNFVSQFFLHVNDPGSAMLTDMTNTDYYTGIHYFWGKGVATGWELHPHAYVILLVLAFVYLRDDVVEGSFFRRWGWWLSVLAIFACTIPGNYVQEVGGIMSGISVLIAVAAAIGNGRQVKAAGKVA
jgi:hypothetical protein